jgi:hypothetical protein
MWFKSHFLAVSMVIFGFETGRTARNDGLNLVKLHFVQEDLK